MPHQVIPYHVAWAPEEFLQCAENRPVTQSPNVENVERDLLQIIARPGAHLSTLGAYPPLVTGATVDTLALALVKCIGNNFPLLLAAIKTTLPSTKSAIQGILLDMAMLAGS